MIRSQVPVGSTGIKHEIETLAKENNLKNIEARQNKIDILKSEGPSTVVLATLAKHHIEELKKSMNKPMTIVANLSLD